MRRTGTIRKNGFMFTYSRRVTVSSDYTREMNTGINFSVTAPNGDIILCSYDVNNDVKQLAADVFWFEITKYNVENEL